MPTLTIDEMRDLLTSNHTARCEAPSHPNLGRRCLIRTYSAGVHAGTIHWVNPDTSTEITLIDAVRIWQWTGGNLSLSSLAVRGMSGGRVNETPEITLTGVIEMIPITEKVMESFRKFVEA